MDQAAVTKRCRPDPVASSMVQSHQLPPKKRATLKARDNEIDLNIRSPQEIRDHPILEITQSLMHQDAEIEMIKTDPDAIKEHRQLEKGRKGSYQCHQCDDEFQTNKKLLIHKATQHDNQKITESEMVYLLQQQQKETQPKLSCQNLPKREKIEKKPSSGGKGGFECEICKVKFMKRGMLLCHITKTHPKASKMEFSSLSSGTVKYEDKRWMCPYCDRRYLSSGKRREHIKKAHPNQEIPPSIKKAGIEKAFVTFIENSTRKPHECPYCPMEYAHRTKLLKHCKDKHKDQPVPYKYNKWKARDNEAREERGKARDIQMLLTKTNHEKQLQLEDQPIKSLLATESTATLSRNDNSIGTLDLWCDSNATGDSTQSSLINNDTANSSRDMIPYGFSEDALDGLLVDEDTRHSAASSSFCHQPEQFRSPTPSSDVATSSQSCPAQANDILNSFFPTNNSFSSTMDEIEKSRLLSDMTRTTETSNSTNSLLTYDPNSFQSQPTPCRARNATFSGLPTSSNNTTTDLSVLDACDDSAQSAPAGFTFDSITIPDYKTEQSQVTNADLLQQAIQQTGFGRPDGVIDESPNPPSQLLSELNNNKNQHLMTTPILKSPQGVAVVLDNSGLVSGQSGEQIVYVQLADSSSEHSLPHFDHQHYQPQPIHYLQNQQNVIQCVLNQPVLKHPVPKVISPPKRRMKGSSPSINRHHRRRLQSPRKLAPKIQPQQFIALATTPFENGNTFVVNNSQLIFSSPDLPK